MHKIYQYAKNNKYFLLLLFISLVFLAVNVRINYFKYNNFDYGKFDLGNMTQMVWNASKGRGLYLTDYFGTNLPRWAMSHVDPILYAFVPIFILFPSPLTLVFSQLVLVIFSSLLVFKIAKVHLKSELAAFLLGFAFLFNPSIGYLTATSGFHGVTAVIPFFLGAFYIFEKMYFEKDYSKKNIILFSLFAVLTMMGKEQISLYTLLYGLFIIFLRNEGAGSLKGLFATKSGKIGLILSLASLIWFFIAFFVIIPANAHYRVAGYKKFADTIEIGGSTARDVALPNYFLNRYEEFGESYTEIVKNMALNPKKSIQVFFGGDKVENFRRTFEPFAFLPFAYPAILILAVPDILINFMTSAGGIGTAEVTNHRISMILPVLALATLFGIKYLSNLARIKGYRNYTYVFLSGVVVAFTIYTSHHYNNPAYLWMREAFRKKVVVRVFAKSDKELVNKDLEVGEVVRLSELEFKDVGCARKIVEVIPEGVSVSGPDSLGAHLAQRETYAIFPALYNEADYVIVDVFARKILTILDVNTEIITDVIESLIKDPNYTMRLGCGNYFVFENVGPHDKNPLLPIQERFKYQEKYKYEFFQDLEIVDFSIPEEFKRGNSRLISVVYLRVDDDSGKHSSLVDYKMFTSFVNSSTGQIYQMANLPSFALREPGGWVEGRYYLEDIEIVMPEFVDAGDYMVFIGMGNHIRTRSMYLGSVKVF